MADERGSDDRTRGRGRGGKRRGDHRGGPHRRGRGRQVVGRGDVRAAVLTLLAEAPMHGYQIMQELAERTGGVWQPSPGSIYPLLQQLTDEGLLTVSEDSDRKVFQLTDDGRAAAAEAPTTPVWERLANEGGVDLKDAIKAVATAAAQITYTGSDEQVAAAAEILADARKRLYLVLAEG